MPANNATNSAITVHITKIVFRSKFPRIFGAANSGPTDDVVDWVTTWEGKTVVGALTITSAMGVDASADNLATASILTTGCSCVLGAKSKLPQTLQGNLCSVPSEPQFRQRVFIDGSR